MTETDASWKKKYSTAIQSAEPNDPFALEMVGISPPARRPMASAIAGHWAMMFGTRTSTRPIRMSTLSVDAHLRTTGVPYSAMTKMHAPTISVHSQYGRPESV